LDLLTIFFWICQRFFLVLLTNFFGFVNKNFWICGRNVLDRWTKFCGFTDGRCHLLSCLGTAKNLSETLQLILSALATITTSSCCCLLLSSSTLLLLPLTVLLPLLHPLHGAEAEDQQKNHHLDDNDNVYDVTTRRFLSLYRLLLLKKGHIFTHFMHQTAF